MLFRPHLRGNDILIAENLRGEGYDPLWYKWWISGCLASRCIEWVALQLILQSAALSLKEVSNMLDGSAAAQKKMQEPDE